MDGDERTHTHTSAHPIHAAPTRRRRAGCTFSENHENESYSNSNGKLFPFPAAVTKQNCTAAGEGGWGTEACECGTNMSTVIYRNSLHAILCVFVCLCFTFNAFVVCSRCIPYLPLSVGEFSWFQTEPINQQFNW